MKILSSILLAFSMFSRLPTPKVEWKPENMRYMMVGFPLIGGVIGLLLLVWTQICQIFMFGTALTACGLTLLPIAVTGGIHLDGFCDTVDALSSHAEPKRKCEILKDPHAGAFAIIGLGAYLLLYFALCCELLISNRIIALLLCSHILSRVLSAFSVVSLPCENGSGTLHSFADAAHKKAVSVILWFMFFGCVTAILMLSPIGGALMIISASSCFWWLSQIAKKEFDGMRGDLAGYFLQLCELLSLAMIVISVKGGWL